MCAAHSRFECAVSAFPWIYAPGRAVAPPRRKGVSPKFLLISPHKGTASSKQPGKTDNLLVFFPDIIVISLVLSLSNAIPYMARLLSLKQVCVHREAINTTG